MFVLFVDCNADTTVVSGSEDLGPDQRFKILEGQWPPSRLGEAPCQ